MKSIQNLKVLKARSPNFKNFGKLSTIRKEMNEIWKKLNEINQVHGSSIRPLFFVATNWRRKYIKQADLYWCNQWHCIDYQKNVYVDKKNNTEYALLCTKEGLMTIRHYKVRDTTTNLLKIISNELKSEPSLFHFHS